MRPSPAVSAFVLAYTLLMGSVGAQQLPTESEVLPTDGRALGTEDYWLPWAATVFSPAVGPTEPVDNLVRAFPSGLLRHPLDLPESIRLSLLERRLVDGPSVEDFAVQIVPHLTDMVRHDRLFLYVEHQALVGWLPVGEVPHGAHRLGQWWIWCNGHELQRAARYPERPARVREEMQRRGVSVWSERDVDRHVEAAIELNRSIELYMLRHRLSLEDAILRVKRERIELARMLIVGYFGAFATAAGTIAAGPNPAEQRATMQPSTLAERQRYTAPRVRSDTPAGTATAQPPKGARHEAPYESHLAGPGPAADGGGGRGSNHLRPDPSAQGAHSTFKSDPTTGKVTGHVEWQPNPRNPSGFDQAKRVDTQYANPHTHHNKATGQQVPTPHAHDSSAPGGVCPARRDEVPQ